MPYLRITLFCAILVLTGAGCTNTQEKIIQTEQEEMTREQQAYVFCTNHGYTINIVQNDDLSTSIYCDIGTEPRCLATDFLDDTCPSNKLVNFFGEEIKEEADVEQCSNATKPVCGTNNRTYTNNCIAKQLGMEKKHDGPCDHQANTPITNTEDLEFNARPPKKRSSSKKSTKKPTKHNQKTQVITENATEAAPDWLTTSIALFDDEAKKTAQSFYCKKDNTIHYLVEENCTECVTTLYTQSGNLVCYPSHDFDNSCPADFLNSSPPDYCSRLSL